MSVRYPFYELAYRRPEADGTVRRCFHAADESTRALFVWEVDCSPVVQAQLLLGDETWVEWRRDDIQSGHTNRARPDAGQAAVPGEPEGGREHARLKGVRTLEPATDPRLFDRAREVLRASDLPAPLVHALLARLGGAAHD